MSGRKAYSQEEQPFPCENPRCPHYTVTNHKRDWFCSQRCRALASLQRDFDQQLERISDFLDAIDA